MKYLLIPMIFLFACESHIDPCKRNIRQPPHEDSFRVHFFENLGYVVGKYENLSVPDKDGYYNWDHPETMRIFTRLVFDLRIQKYYPFPDNQSGPYNTIWEKDSCAAKVHWFKYEKQWVK